MIYDTFTAANTAKGFSSFFEELIREKTLKNVYLIKGGPGCGKSTLMKKIAAHFDKDGYTIEQIHCSSDPHSLDGVKIEELDTVIIDATAPHSFDMKYPGVTDSILDLSKFWDKRALKSNSESIIKLFDDISERYKNVYSMLKAAGALYTQQITESERFCNKEKATAFFKKLVKQNAFTPIGSAEKISRRYLSAISCNGTGAFGNTVSTLCKSCVVIDDDLGVSNAVLSRFATYFRRSGYDIKVFYNPLCPENKIDHIIVGGLGFGIFTSSSYFPIELDQTLNIKHVNGKTFIDKAYYESNKSKITQRKKHILQLLENSVSALAEIKAMHDELESFYIEATDHKKLNLYTEKVIEDIKLY